MAAMFYSLQEAAERLGKTEADIRGIVQSGQLREFRDGPNLLFKVDEVEALAAQVPAGPPAPPPPPAPGAPPPIPQYETPVGIPLEFDSPQDEIPIELGEPQVFEPAEPMLEEFDVPQDELAEPEMLELEMPAESEPVEMDIAGFDISDEAGREFEIPSEPEALEMDMADLELDEEPGAGLEIPSESGSPEMELSDLDISELDDQIAQGPPAGTSEILLAQEAGGSAAPSELTNADTAITAGGVNVLGETDQDYAITDDTLGETIGSIGLASTGTTPDAALEEIEGDVNLDSFGSGSGLLDLSLQADDTSLGGILDEIYTAEDEAVEPADAGTVAEVAAEADQMAADEAILTPQAALAMPGMAQAYFEPAPDKASNILGAMLFVPLLFFAYMAIVAVGGLKGVAPSLLKATQSFIWYIVGGFSAITAGIGLYAILMADKEASPAAKKPAKAKKAKKEKKPKKPKKEKKK